MIVNIIIFLLGDDQLKFGAEICDEVDEQNLRIRLVYLIVQAPVSTSPLPPPPPLTTTTTRLLTLASQATLPDHHRALVWEWLLRWPRESITSDSHLEGENQEEHNMAFEMELRHKVLQPSLFDSHGITVVLICCLIELICCCY